RLVLVDLMIDFAERVILARRRDALHGVTAGRTGLGPVRLRIEQQIRPCRGVDVAAGARRAARHRGNGRLAPVLPQPFVAAEEEGAILDDRSTQVTAELIARELWNVLIRRIEVRLRIEGAVAIELEHGATHGVRSGTRDRGDDSASAPAVLGAVVVHEHLELTHGVHAEQAAGGAPGGSVTLRVGISAVELI